MKNEIMQTQNKVMVGNDSYLLDKEFASKFLGIENITEKELAVITTKAITQGLNIFTDVSVVAYTNQNGRSVDIIEKEENKRKRAYKTGMVKSIKQGIAVINGNGEFETRQSEFFITGVDKLIGAWCEIDHAELGVVRKDVNFNEYNTNKSTWEKKPITMISKVARGQCLDLCFPNLFEGLRTYEEIEGHHDIIHVEGNVVDQSASEKIEAKSIPIENKKPKPLKTKVVKKAPEAPEFREDDIQDAEVIENEPEVIEEVEEIASFEDVEDEYIGLSEEEKLQKVRFEFAKLYNKSGLSASEASEMFDIENRKTFSDWINLRNEIAEYINKK